MKTLSIQQPWAQLIASGIKEVDNRTWATKHRGKILIHASSKKVTASWYKKTFIEWAQVTANHQFFGNIPYDDELPTCAIIGYVEVVDCVEGTDYINQIFPEPGSDQMADIKQLRFVYGDKSVTRNVADACITLDVDKNDKPVEGYSLFSPEPDFYRNVFFQLA